MPRSARREYLLFVNPDTICILMGNWRHHEMISLPVITEAMTLTGEKFDLPPDYLCEDATYSWERKAIGIRISHRSFPEVPDGAWAPELVCTGVQVRLMATKSANGPIVVRKLSGD